MYFEIPDPYGLWDELYETIAEKLGIDCMELTSEQLRMELTNIIALYKDHNN